MSDSRETQNLSPISASASDPVEAAQTPWKSRRDRVNFHRATQVNPAAPFLTPEQLQYAALEARTMIGAALLATEGSLLNFIAANSPGSNMTPTELAVKYLPRLVNEFNREKTRPRVISEGEAPVPEGIADDKWVLAWDHLRFGKTSQSAFEYALDHGPQSRTPALLHAQHLAAVLKLPADGEELTAAEALMLSSISVQVPGITNALNILARILEIAPNNRVALAAATADVKDALAKVAVESHRPWLGPMVDEHPVDGSLNQSVDRVRARIRTSADSAILADGLLSTAENLLASPQLDSEQLAIAERVIALFDQRRPSSAEIATLWDEAQHFAVEEIADRVRSNQMQVEHDLTYGNYSSVEDAARNLRSDSKRILKSAVTLWERPSTLASIGLAPEDAERPVVAGSTLLTTTLDEPAGERPSRLKRVLQAAGAVVAAAVAATGAALAVSVNVADNLTSLRSSNVVESEERKSPRTSTTPSPEATSDASEPVVEAKTTGPAVEAEPQPESTRRVVQAGVADEPEPTQPPRTRATIAQPTAGPTSKPPRIVSTTPAAIPTNAAPTAAEPTTAPPSAVPPTAKPPVTTPPALASVTAEPAQSASPIETEPADAEPIEEPALGNTADPAEPVANLAIGAVVPGSASNSRTTQRVATTVAAAAGGADEVEADLDYVGVHREYKGKHRNYTGTHRALEATSPFAIDMTKTEPLKITIAAPAADNSRVDLPLRLAVPVGGLDF